METDLQGADEVLCVVQYWLQNVTNPPDILDMNKFDTDAVYARHIGQLNVFTFLIEHRDSNQGNFLISKAEQGPRVFSIDHGVAFASLDSDRGTAWLELRVDRLPKDTIERVRRLTKDELTAKLGVLGQWELRDGHYVPVEPTANMGANRGVRIRDGIVQMGHARGDLGGRQPGEAAPEPGGPRQGQGVLTCRRHPSGSGVPVNGARIEGCRPW